MPRSFDHDAGTSRLSYDFDAMTDQELERLLAETPEGKKVDALVKALQVDAALEGKIRGVVAQGLKAGAALLKKSLGA